MAFGRLNSGIATRRGFAFAVVKPALKRGPTLDCRYRGKAKPVTRKALNWKRGGYARLLLSRLELSARADGERSPAIHRRVLLEMNLSSRRDG